MSTRDRLRFCLLALALAVALWLVLRALGLAAEPESRRVFGRGPWPGLWLGAVLGTGLATLLIALGRTLAAMRQQGGRVPTLFSAFRLALNAAAAVWLLFVFNIQPLDVRWLPLALAAAASLWGTLLLFSSGWVASKPAPWRRPLRWLDLLLFNLLALAIGLELGMRLMGTWWPSPILSQEDARAEYIVRRKKNTKPGQVRFGFPKNSAGHYDSEFRPTPPQRPSVAFIGDSFSFGVVPHHFHFSTVAERQLGAEVYNFGLPGIGPLEYLVILRHEALPLGPDLIAINLFVGNDIQDSRRYRMRNRRLRMWLERENMLLLRVPRNWWRVFSERQANDGRAAGAHVGESQGKRLHTVQEMVEQYPWLEDAQREVPVFTERRFLDVESRRASAVCDPEKANYAQIFAVLDAIRRAAGDRPMVVHLIPDEFQLNDELWSRIQQKAEGKTLERDLPQRVLGRWLAAQRVPVLDLLPVLRRHCANNDQDSDRCYHLRDTHFNSRGNRVAGQAMAAFLEPWIAPLRTSDASEAAEQATRQPR